ncbi:hypothetical protein L209DRAFT_341222 [Thermothelomyces heterothallicus CBS 203.75]
MYGSGVRFALTWLHFRMGLCSIRGSPSGTQAPGLRKLHSDSEREMVDRLRSGTARSLIANNDCCPSPERFPQHHG